MLRASRMSRAVRRAAAGIALALALVCGAATPARAQVTEPNGLVVPQNPVPSEVPLSTFFSGRGEHIDALADAHAMPATFAPLCAFRVTFVLNQAGRHLGLGWYNVGPTAPTASAIYQIVPVGASVGTVVGGAGILGDPRYAGGQIGFALIGAQTHFSEAEWNPVCTSCTPPLPWTLALMYASTSEPDAYYVCFEDGPVDASRFNNDGDFNDDVFFVEGVSPRESEGCCVTDADCDDRDPTTTDRCVAMRCVHGLPVDAGPPRDAATPDAAIPRDLGADARVDGGGAIDAGYVLSEWPLGANCCSVAGTRGPERAPLALVAGVLMLAAWRRRR